MLYMSPDLCGNGIRICKNAKRPGHLPERFYKK
jgi:hypothetical protein